MPCRRAAQGASDQRVPMTARANSRTGHARAGCARSRTKVFQSMVGATTISQRTMKAVVAEVDQGREAAVSTARMSTARSQAAEWRHAWNRSSQGVHLEGARSAVDSKVMVVRFENSRSVGGEAVERGRGAGTLS